MKQITEKYCSGCNKVLPAENFGLFNLKGLVYRQSKCKSCLAIAGRKRRGIAPVKCENCGKETTRKHYCSPECWKTARRAKQRVRETSREERIARLPKDFTIADWKKALAYFNYKCAYCETPLGKAEQDHFIPVKQGGGYTKNNIVPACPVCNSRKRAKNPLDWLVTQVHGLVAYVRVKQYLERS